MAVFIDFPSGTGTGGEKGEKGDKGDTLYSVKIDTTLEASNWSNGTYKITSNEINADSLVDIGLQTDITEAQVDGLIKGKIVATDQGDGYITLTAYGDVPTVDIPITVVIEGSQLDTVVVEKVSGDTTDYGAINVSNDNVITIKEAVGKKQTTITQTQGTADSDGNYTITTVTNVGEVFNYGDYGLGVAKRYDSTGASITGGGSNKYTSYPKATGAVSHAEGYNTVASGRYSHAQNEGTIAASLAQTSLGRYNISDSNDTYAFIIGDGTSDSARHNLFAIGWDNKIYVNNSSSQFVGIDLTEISGGTGGTSTVNWVGTQTSGEEIGKLTVDGVSYTLYSTNTDELVKNTLSQTTKAYITGTSQSETNTGSQYFDTDVYLGEEKGSLYATTFYGELSGNAATATVAVNASGVTVAETNPASQITYHPYWGTITSGDGTILRDNDGYTYTTKNGTTSANGIATLNLGNSTKSGTAGNKTGAIKLYGSNTGANTLYTSNATTSSYTNYLPADSGTLALSTSTQIIQLVEGKEYLIVNGPMVTLVFNRLTLSEYVAIGSAYLPTTEVPILLQTINSDIGYFANTTNTNPYYGYTSRYEAAFSTIDSSGLNDITRLESLVDTLSTDGTGTILPTNTTSKLLKTKFASNSSVMIIGTVSYVRNYTT